jgi:hypothetical protein
MDGLRDGLVVYTATNIARFQEPMLNQFNWESINEVRISLYDLSGGYFIMDDLEYSLSSVPIPAAVWLFRSGLIGFIGFAKKKAVQQ